MTIDEWVAVRVKRIEFTTPAALQCDFGPIQEWIPKSQVRDYELYGYSSGYAGALSVKRWLIRKKNLQPFVIDGSTGPPPGAEPEQPVAATVELVTATEIYRRLVRKYHPDLNPQAGEVLRDLNELWQAVRKDIRGGGSQNGKS